MLKHQQPRRPTSATPAGLSAIVVLSIASLAPGLANAQISPPRASPPASGSEAAPSPPGIWVDPPRAAEPQDRQRRQRQAPGNGGDSEFGCPAQERDLQLMV